MAEMIGSDKSLPGTIGTPSIEVGGHSGNTTVVSELTIQTSITGDITVVSGGTLIIEGELIGNLANGGTVTILGTVQGDINNQSGGTLTVESGGFFQGNLDTQGNYNLHGRHNGDQMNLLAGSYTFITGKGRIDLFSEQGAQMEVTKTAEIRKSDNNDKEKIVNSGSITISGGSIAHSLSSTGTVVFTGSGTFS